MVTLKSDGASVSLRAELDPLPTQVKSKEETKRSMRTE